MGVVSDPPYAATLSAIYARLSGCEPSLSDHVRDLVRKRWHVVAHKDGLPAVPHGPLGGYRIRVPASCTGWSLWPHGRRPRLPG